MLRLKRFGLEDQVIALLSFFLHLGQELVILHTHNFLLGCQSLFCFYLKLHVVIKELLVLAVIADTFKLFVQTAPFSQVIIARLHVAESTE